MDIEKAKDLCLEYERLEQVISVIERAIERGHWLKIKSPIDGEAYMSNIQIKSVYDLAKNRIMEIEKEFMK